MKMFTIIELTKLNNITIEIPVGFFVDERLRDEAFKKYFYFSSGNYIPNMDAGGRWAKKGEVIL